MAEETRNLTVIVPRESFGVWKWAWDKAGLNQEDFVKEAMRDKTSKVVADQAAKGKGVPPFVAKYLDQK